jgi:[calcium/calmodulin-dependent protein kinase] kinase
MKAVKRFKKLLFRKRPELMDSIFGRASRIVAPPGSIETKHRKTRSSDAHDRLPVERVLAAEGVHHDVVVSDDLVCSPGEVDEHSSEPNQILDSDEDEDEESDEREAQQNSVDRAMEQPHNKGHAHDPLSETTYLGIGTSSHSPPPVDHSEDSEGKSGLAAHVVCESPGGVDSNFFEQAYQEEMKRILARRGRAPTMYLTKRVEENEAIRDHESVIRHSSDLEGVKSKWAGLASKIRGTNVGDAAKSGARDAGDAGEKE